MSGKKRTDHSVRETAVVYITKYALSAGVWKICAEITDNKYAHSKAEKLWVGPQDWHRTESEAMVRVQEMIEARRKTLSNAAARLDRQEELVRAGKFQVLDKAALQDKQNAAERSSS